MSVSQITNNYSLQKKFETDFISELVISNNWFCKNICAIMNKVFGNYSALDKDNLVIVIKKWRKENDD